jgi:hypothetical protein
MGKRLQGMLFATIDPKGKESERSKKMGGLPNNRPKPEITVQQIHTNSCK